MQLTHKTNTFKSHSFPIVLVCDNITMAANVGSLFRLADAFGVERIVFCGTDPIDLNSRMRKTARGTEQRVRYEFSEDIQHSVNHLRNSGYDVVTVEITDDSIPMHTFDFSNHKKVALIIGNENHGVSEAILEQSEAIVHISMFGQNSSMNVAQAANISLYEITKQWLTR